MIIWHLFRWYHFTCPACGEDFARSLSPYLLGPGTRTCERCLQLTADGSREWPELGRAQKIEFLFPVTVIGWLGAAVVVGIAGVVIGWPDLEQSIGIGLIGFLFFALPWMPYFLRRWHQVRQSRQRMSSKGVG